MIPFCKPSKTANELAHVSEVLRSGASSGGAKFSQLSCDWLKTNVGAKQAILTTSCTAALEACSVLADIQPGDEVIMPSFTFVSTANAFVLRGAIPVFVDVRPDTMNIDERLIERAITKKTRAIVPVHYAGVACAMDEIMDIAKRHNLVVIEDAAQAIDATYKGRPLGGIGHMSAFSFHQTKNISCGEGGALVINDEALVRRAEIVCEKGTNRKEFFRGFVDKYTWVDVGSSYMLSDINAAVLWSQLEDIKAVHARRRAIFDTYLERLGPAFRAHGFTLPQIPAECHHNAHIFFAFTPTARLRDDFIATLQSHSVGAVFHYVPLHSAPAGMHFARADGPLSLTTEMAARLVRLPLFADMTSTDVETVINGTKIALDEVFPRSSQRELAAST